MMIVFIIYKNFLPKKILIDLTAEIATLLAVVCNDEIE